MKFWNFTQPGENNEAIELRIDGVITDDDDSWLYDWMGIQYAAPNEFRQELAKYTGKDINVWINSNGGDVTAGAGIYNALKSHQGKITVKIDSKAMSSASIIAMAGDTIEISPVGQMMIHNPWTGMQGEAKDFRHIADVLDTVKSTIVNAYQLKTGRTRDEISQMMDNETWMDPQEAVDQKFADKIINYETGPSIENKSAPHIFNMAMANKTAMAAIQRFINKNTEENKMEDNQKAIKTIENLKSAYPHLCNELIDEGIKNERSRINELDKIDVIENKTIHEIITNAKNDGKTAAEMKNIVDIISKNDKKEPDLGNKAQDFIVQAIEDNKKSGADNVKPSPVNNDAAKQEDELAIKNMAELINKKNGRLQNNGGIK